jgi:hypothetical protein
MPATPEEINSQIAEWEKALEDLREEARQVQAITPTGYHAVNPRGVRQFQFQIQKRNQSIHDDFMLAKQRLQKLYDERDKGIKGAAGQPGQPKQMTEAQLAHERDIQIKRGEDVEAQTPQKKLAESQLEQQKAADAQSANELATPLIGPKGVQPQSLRDLMTKYGMHLDKDTGEYVFNQDNSEGNITAEQTRKSKELVNTMKAFGYSPEEIFGPGAKAPSFNKSGNSVPGSGSLYNGTKDQYDAWKQTYQDSQPKDKIELRVPMDVIGNAYNKYAPAYGGSLPENPLFTDAKIQAMPRDPNAPERLDPAVMAQAEGRVDAISRQLGRPARLTVRPEAPTGGVSLNTPITLGTGGAVGTEPPQVPLVAGAEVQNAKRGLQISSGAPRPSAEEAAAVADRAAVAPKVLDSVANQYGVGAPIIADIRARKQAAVASGQLTQEEADLAEQRARESASAKAKVAAIPEVAGAAGTVLEGFTPMGALKTAYNTFGVASDLWSKQQDEEDKKRKAAALLLGENPASYDELNPPSV